LRILAGGYYTIKPSYWELFAPTSQKLNNIITFLLALKIKQQVSPLSFHFFLVA
jgi:hypothetical protein